MKSHLLRRLLGVAITVILFLACRTAAAQLPADRTFPIVGVDRGLILRIGPRTDADQVIRRFKDWYRNETGGNLTKRVLYDANPHGTIATCPFRTDGLPTFNPRNPHDDSVWDGCDPPRKSIALIAGAYIRIPSEHVGSSVDELDDGDASAPPSAPPSAPKVAPKTASKPAADAPSTPKPASSVASGQPVQEPATPPEPTASPSATTDPVAAPSAPEAPASSVATATASAEAADGTPPASPSATGTVTNPGETAASKSRVTDAEPDTWLMRQWRFLLFLTGLVIVAGLFIWNKRSWLFGSRGPLKSLFSTDHALNQARTKPEPEEDEGVSRNKMTQKRINPPAQAPSVPMEPEPDQDDQGRDPGG